MSLYSHKTPGFSVQTPYQHSSVEENPLEIQISGGLGDLQGDRNPPKVVVSGCIDSICQWYFMEIDGQRPEAEWKSTGKSDTSPNEDIPKNEESSPKPLYLSKGSKVKRDTIPTLVNSSISVISTKAPPVAKLTTITVDISQNSTILPPLSFDALNSSTALESRVGDSGLVQTDVWVRCPTPEQVIESFTPEYYRNRRHFRSFPNWASEILVSSRAEVIEQLRKKMGDCGMCDCQLQTEVVGGFWGLVPNVPFAPIAHLSSQPEECATESAANWCKDILGCYCEEVAEASGELSQTNRFLVHRISRGRYLRGGSEYVGLSAANLLSLQEYMVAREEHLEAVPLAPPIPEEFLVPDPQQPEAPIVLEGPDPLQNPDHPDQWDQLPDYSIVNNIASQPVPPRYRRLDPAAENRHGRARIWNSFLAGAGALGDRFFGGRARNRFRGGGGGSGSGGGLKRREADTNAPEKGNRTCSL
ncbi:uncharacterized protein DFL_007634 [Arthrobotrys flagrans]|uniref:Uncharacterized protein n=1 Tax=Arthrobotrys flagrans TaxID=97331 RepID=A0A436ZW87_ARTFL|nr:hypothetical protein DFL_007634 [Arthrobotrys flagrans]